MGGWTWLEAPNQIPDCRSSRLRVVGWTGSYMSITYNKNPGKKRKEVKGNQRKKREEPCPQTSHTSLKKKNHETAKAHQGRAQGGAIINKEGNHWAQTADNCTMEQAEEDLIEKKKQLIV